MPAHKPEECDLLLFEALETGNLDAAIALYEPDAIFVVSPDQFITGHAAIREFMQDIIATNATRQRPGAQQPRCGPRGAG